MIDDNSDNPKRKRGRVPGSRTPVDATGYVAQRKHLPGKRKTSAAERRQQSKEDTERRVLQGLQLDREFAALKTDEDRILWLARLGVEADDIATKLSLHRRLATDADFKGTFEGLVKRGLADMRIELAKTIISEARLGQVSALKSAAQAYLAAYKDGVADVEFAGGYRAKVEELLAKLGDDQHTHVIRKFRFE